ncbi:hypothetical protein GCM10010441_75670 [Kitasatospora paracochleata]|uniref:Uncharacterized protein n=1 Tax=Kitasatospora paracochleata TaxID=58354 RepID=A0ABT1JA08_9ACTN|nr:hypothetical protein [Kitasatospora paracochleata]MCP2314280.1 hypothetical protein [Kitasatospora paracochleata]
MESGSKNGTGLEWQVAAVTGTALNRMAALAAALQDGQWQAARRTAADLRDDLYRLAGLLPSDPATGQETVPEAEHLAALLTAAGYPLALVRALFGQGDVGALRARAREQARAELGDFARTSGGRDALLRRAAAAGLSESEIGRLAGLSRTTVRVVLGKGMAT